MKDNPRTFRGFVALDFETATAQRNSACAIGVVRVDYQPDGDWRISEDSIYELIKPPDNHYNDINIGIHGITPKMTAKARTIDRVWENIRPLFEGRLLLAHNAAFDMSVLRRSCEALNYDPGSFTQACTYRLAKATWPEMWSYRLDVLAEEFGIEFEHHHAAWDAYAAAILASHICNQHGVATVEEVVAKLSFQSTQSKSQPQPQPQPRNYYQSAKSLSHLVPDQPIGDDDHSLFGKRLVFTGTLDNFSRHEAAQLAVNVGAIPQSGISTKTDYLVIGATDFRRIKGNMSAKMRKAADLAARGSGIEIIDELEFLTLLNADI